MLPAPEETARALGMGTAPEPEPDSALAWGWVMAMVLDSAEEPASEQESVPVKETVSGQLALGSTHTL